MLGFGWRDVLRATVAAVLILAYVYVMTVAYLVGFGA